MTVLSVNINKVATLRNARGGNVPDVVRFAVDCEHYGAQGITVHPRPDERHIRYKDVYDLKQVVTTEFNIEGYPSETFVDMVCKIRPAQVTLVPDSPHDLTSHEGWNIAENVDFLGSLIERFHQAGVRVSLFIRPEVECVIKAAEICADRVELYTEPYAAGYSENREYAIRPYMQAALKAREIGIGLNAGHDLNLENLRYFHQQIPWLDEVSIGHALISDALYFGIERTIGEYLQKLNNND